jgi:CheY-like chemotaxis protein
LNQETQLDRPDEIGELAEAFDTMTQHLRERTDEAARLYAETVQRNTELAEINVRLQNTQQQLVQSEKLAAVGQLTAGIVHDVKNPLTVIKGMAETLQDEPSLQPYAGQELALIRESATKANQIVSDLLTFSRQSTPEMQQQDLKATVEAALRITTYLTRLAQVKVITALPDRSVYIIYDAQQIEQVLINLIQNAIQSMPHGGTLYIELSQTDDTVALAVQDTGTGISQKTCAASLIHSLPPSPQAKAQGWDCRSAMASSCAITGASMSIARSDKARRLLFFCLNGSLKLKIRRMFAMDPEKILVVDDDEALLFLMTSHLERQGYAVESTTNPFQALERLKTKGPFAVLVTDLMMPYMDGVQLLRKAHQLDPHLEVVVITAAASVETAIAAMREDGAYNYLMKPLESINELSIAVKRAAAYRRLQLEREELQAHAQAETERLHLLIANIGDAILAADTQGNLSVVNPAAARLLGRNNLIGCDALTSLPRPLAILLSNWRATSGERPAAIEITWPGTATQMVSLTPIVDGGVANGWVMVIRDISHLKQLDELKTQTLTDTANRIRMPLVQAMNLITELSNPAALSTERMNDIVYRLVKTWQRIHSGPTTCWNWPSTNQAGRRHGSGESARLPTTSWHPYRRMPCAPNACGWKPACLPMYPLYAPMRQCCARRCRA